MRSKYLWLVIGIIGLPITVAASDLRVSGQVISETTGKPPFAVSSSDTVPGLSAELWQGAKVSDLSQPSGPISVHYKNLIGIPGKAITQDCALTSGCFAGDDPGFPVTITQPGAYRLESNLDVSGEPTPEEVTAIDVSSPDVTLDLGGFRIQGPVVCTDTPVSSCSPVPSSGVHASGILVGQGSSEKDSLSHVAIHNGIIRGMGEYGIKCHIISCVISDITVSESGRIGIRFPHFDQPSRLTNITSYRNGDDGFSIKRSLAKNIIAKGNGGEGIVAGAGSRIQDSIADNNAAHGFVVTAGTAVSSSTAAENGLIGINCAGHCLLIDNLIRDNGEFGIDFRVDANKSAWKGNMLYGNSSGSSNGTATSLGNNSCDGALC